MAKIKVESFIVKRTMQSERDNPLLKGVYTVFTDGAGRSTTSRWTSPQDHAPVDLSYLQNRHPNIKTKRHIQLYTEHYNDYIPRLKSGEIVESNVGIDITVMKNNIKEAFHALRQSNRSAPQYIQKNSIARRISATLQTQRNNIEPSILPVVDLLSDGRSQFVINDANITEIHPLDHALTLLESLAITVSGTLSIIDIIDDSKELIE